MIEAARYVKRRDYAATWTVSGKQGAPSYTQNKY
jgi:hypothetical protein